MRIESASFGWVGWAAAGLRTASLPAECAQWHDEVRAEIEDMCSLATAFLHCCCECSKPTLEDEEWAKSRGFTQ